MSVTFYVNGWDEQTSTEQKVFLCDLYPHSEESVWAADILNGDPYVKLDPTTNRHYQMETVYDNAFPEMNMCNSNAAAILRAVGLHDSEDDLCGNVSQKEIPTVIQNIMLVLNSDEKVNLHTRERTVSMNADKENARLTPRFISFGINAEYIKDRLNELLTFVKFAQDNDKGFYWG